MIAIDQIIMILTFASSAIALYFSLKKQSHDTDNIDADTITKLYDLIDKQEERYNKLQKDFIEYKKDMNTQIANLVDENIKLRKWAKTLASQLEQAGIMPSTYEH